MRAVVDSSAWISLARSGLLTVLARVDLDPVLLDVVRAECVAAGLATGYADAAVIETAMDRLEVQPTRGHPVGVDAGVLESARGVGALVTNDLALGRRARSLGLVWLRTADLIVWSVRSGRMSASEGRRAVQALVAAGRITPDLAKDYLEEMT